MEMEVFSWCTPGSFSTFFIFSCSKDTPPASTLPMHWQPIDSLNLSLPKGIQVFAGRNDSLPLRAWYVYVNEPRQDITTRIVVSDDTSDNRETVTSFAGDLGAAVVVNAGYFTMRKTPAGHAGLLMIDGKLLEPATRSVLRDSLRYEVARAAFGFMETGEAVVGWLTSCNDSLFRWPNPPQHLPEKPAEPLDYSKAEYIKLRDAIGTGPMLVMDGNISITSDEEVFFGTSIPKIHPRTAAGISADGSLILMVVDGRQEESRGVSLEELAVLMREAGAVAALNLDGGGSSTMVVNNILLNRPAGKLIQRQVMSALAVFHIP